MKKFQIGVIGTLADKKLSSNLITIAKEVGKEVAKGGNTLLFGAELDADSLSTQAAKSARKHGGISIAIVYGSDGNIFDQESADFIIRTGSERGGPRESSFIMSCDGVIAISGGSGTMAEMLIAYMNNIPVVVIKGTGGWSDKMANKYFDHRKRSKAVGVMNANDAVKTIIREIKNNNSLSLKTSHN